MTFKKTAETLIKDSHTLDQKYYLNQDILDQEQIKFEPKAIAELINKYFPDTGGWCVL